MKTLQIEIPEGYEVSDFDLKTGKIQFKEKPKSITDRIKTFEDVLEAHGIKQSSFNKRIKDLLPDEAAYIQAKMIVECLNEGWQPDWDNSSERKYYPWFEMSSLGFRYGAYGDWTTDSTVGSRLCFKSKELAKYAGTQFSDIYEKLMII